MDWAGVQTVAAGLVRSQLHGYMDVGSIWLTMATGILIAESLKDDATLQGSWQLTRIERVTVTKLPEEQRGAGLPSAWTLLQFELGDGRAEALAHALAAELLRSGWCAKLNIEAETLLVFAGRIFRYPSDDDDARAEAYAYGVANGVPEEQLVRLDAARALRGSGWDGDLEQFRSTRT
jgi:hypothetical protein